jgi:hypothetical protein
LTGSTFTTRVALDTYFAAGTGTSWTITTGILTGGNLLIPHYSSAGDVGVVIGTPTSAPAWTYVPLYGKAQPGSTMTMLHQASQDVFAWSQTNLTAGDISQVFMCASTDAGASWSWPVLVLDLAVTPPPPVSGSDTVDMDSISLGDLGAGAIGLMWTGSGWAAYYAPPLSAPAPAGFGNVAY